MTIAELNAALKAIADKAETESRSLTDEEVSQYETLEGELLAARKTAEVQARSKLLSNIVMPAVISAVSQSDKDQERAFESYLRTGQRNSDLIESRAQGEGTTTAGGYTVPTLFRQKLTERLLAFGGLATAAESFTTGNGDTINWPSIDDTASDHADIAAEGAATAAGADLVFGTVSLGAYRYTAAGASNLPVKVSVELLQDASFDISAFVAKALGTRIGRKQAVDLMQGSGSGAPQGLMYGAAVAGTNCATVIETASGSVPTYANLVDLVHGVDPLYRMGASFIMNDATMAVVEKILDNNDRPILVSSLNGIASPVGSATLLGYPIVIDQAAFALSDEVTGIVFGDLAEAYIIRRVADVSVLVDPYSYGIDGQVGFSAWARMDGKIQQKYAIAKLEGES